jgi:hypothetical protein
MELGRAPLTSTIILPPDVVFLLPFPPVGYQLTPSTVSAPSHYTEQETSAHTLHELSLISTPTPTVPTRLFAPAHATFPTWPVRAQESSAMASLLPPSNPAQGRISQLLPTVKCSDCNRLVPIHELGEHICVPPPSPSTNGPSLSNLLVQRVQKMVSSSSASPRFSKTPPPKTPSPVPSLASRQAEVSARRSRALSVTSRKQKSSSPGPTSSAIPPMKPVPTEPLPVPRVPIPEATRSAGSLLPHHIPFPTSRSNTPNIPVGPSQIRAPSVASNHSASSHLSIDTSDRASQPRPSFDSNRPRESSPTATTSSLSAGRPSYDIPRTRTPSDNSRPNALYNPPPPIPSSIPPSVHNPNLPPTRSDVHRIPSPQNNVRSRTNGLVSPPQDTPPPVMTEQPKFQPIIEPDTKIGGEAGMAGVGRRGFHAATRAALFTAQQMNLVGRPSPGFLDIQRAVGTSSDAWPYLSET